MIALTSAQKTILLSNSVKKTWTFEVYNGSSYIDSIPTSKMVADSFSIKEPVCTARSLEIGSCESAVLSVKVADISVDLKGKTIKVTLTATDGTTSVNLPMGVYYVDEVKNQNNTYFYAVTAYDGMSLFDTNISDWYESLSFPITIKEMRTSLCSYVGVSQEKVTLPNDNVRVEKTISASDITGRDVLKSICSINGCFGHFTRTGTLTYLFLGNTSAITLTKGGENYYQTSATHEQWTVAAFDAVTILPDEDSVGGIYPAKGGNNVLKITDNFLSYGKSTDELIAIAQAIYPYVANRPYRVHSTPTRGRPWIEAGDKITIQTEKKGIVGVINTYVLNRTLTGFQGCIDKYEAAGTENVNSDKNSLNIQITRLKGKTNKLVRTVDEMISEIADMDDGYKSTIQQLSNQIGIIVSADDHSINVASIVAAINGNKSSVRISADKIDLTGYVTISSLAEGGSTVIDGSRITTGTISAGRLDITGALSAMQADIEEIIAGKISTAELNADQITAGTISAERLDLAGLVTNGELTSELKKYVTSSELSTTLSSYVTGSILTNTLSHYATSSAVETVLRSYALTTDLENFVTNSELTSELRSYITSSELSTTLSSYVTGSTLTSRLSSYVTSSAMETTLQSYALTSDLEGLVTDSELTSELRSYVTSSELTTTISSYATKTGGTASSFAYSLTPSLFRLTANDTDVLVANSSGVTITGKVTVQSGSSAGGWTISANELYTAKAGMSASDDYVKASLVNSNSTSPVRFYCGNGNRVSGKFVVLDDGSLYAAAANISGTISATAGSFCDTAYPFYIGKAETSGYGCIYSRSSTFAGTGGYGIPSDCNVYIGGDGFSYSGGAHGYATSIRPSLMCCFGDFNWQGEKYQACKYDAKGVSFHWGGTNDLRLNDNLLNNSSVGAFETRSTDVYMTGTFTAASGMSIVSDGNMKNSIYSITDSYALLFDRLKAKTFKYNDGTSGRRHIGFIAQEVKDAIEQSGMTTLDCAAYVEAETVEGETVCSLRYEEFIALNTWQIQLLKLRIKNLEEEVNSLKM